MVYRHEGDENTGSLEEFNHRLLFVASDPRKHIAIDPDSRTIAVTYPVQARPTTDFRILPFR
jgi:hypothetical protein